ncbi:tripartite tricarboxylate transporter substrate binding protein [Siccirubricoccus sp. KC 17139]|uniref:Tripartite tricarboxylate transporter substrate binding protein n=1 Tax=Siccirubricoccus soli TaxID=2899147 RepID=A0ABT1D4X6_9PROT|nr:tripartite tricarboxylate transporter substrate binding protein [Siccirubricoccus soli]MCO6416968.1 tripartite tricarboxylate transporter substrate binding protein [Siccirubricoccus soli]MCP2683103.1 tripartite tricarboxylate transporter substrate binding protein [Siccirubricoccus soli]
MQRRALLAAAGLLPGLAQAQGNAPAGGWPNKPVRIVVPFPPGGPNDIIARLYAQALTPIVGQQVVVENRAGGSGVIGTDYALKSAADGYTVAICDGGSLVIVPHTQSIMPYKVPEEVGLVTVVAKVPEALVAHPSLKVKTLPELLDLAKRQPGKLNIGTAGAAGISHLAAVLFKALTGAEVEVVPYRGAAPAITDLVAGQVQLLFADLPPLLPHLQAKAIVPLALAARERSPSLPELATTAEYGYPKLLAENWYCMVAPPALPAPITEKLSAAMRRASENAQLREALLAQGAQAAWTSRQEFAALVQEESVVWRDIAKAAGVRSD